VTTPGAKLTINGQSVIPENVSSSGCFIGAVFISHDKPEVVVTSEAGGVTRTVRRAFRVVE